MHTGKKLRISSALLVMALSACATPPPAKTPVEVPPVVLPPAPANVMVKREPTFQRRLLNFFSVSPEKPTK